MIFKLWYIHIYCIHLYNYIIIWICILIIYIYCIDIYMYHLSILNPEFFLSSQTRQPPRAAQNWKNFAKLRKTQLSICGLWQLHWRTAGVLSQETSHCLGGARAQGPEVKFCWNLGDSGLQICGVSSQVFVEDVLYWDANCLNADLPTQRIAQIPVPMVTSQHLVESNYTQFSVKRIVLWSALPWCKFGAKKLWLVPRSVGLVESSAYHLKISDHLWTHHVHCWLRAFQGSSFGPSGAAKSMSDFWRPAPPSHVVPGTIKGPMTSIPNSQEIVAGLGKKRSQSNVSIPDAPRFHAGAEQLAR